MVGHWACCQERAKSTPELAKFFISYHIVSAFLVFFTILFPLIIFTLYKLQLHIYLAAHPLVLFLGVGMEKRYKVSRGTLEDGLKVNADNTDIELLN